MEIKQQLQMYLQTGNSISIAKVERELSFETILKIERVAKFCQLTKEQEKNILTLIHMLSDRFFKVNFPDANTSEFASQFAVDILETRPDWTLYDVIYFFKFIRQRQDLDELKVFGNAFKITPIVLSKFLSVYEENNYYEIVRWQNQIVLKLIIQCHL